MQEPSPKAELALAVFQAQPTALETHTLGIDASGKPQAAPGRGERPGDGAHLSVQRPRQAHSGSEELPPSRPTLAPVGDVCRKPHGKRQLEGHVGDPQVKHPRRVARLTVVADTETPLWALLLYLDRKTGIGRGVGERGGERPPPAAEPFDRPHPKPEGLKHQRQVAPGALEPQGPELP